MSKKVKFELTIRFLEKPVKSDDDFKEITKNTCKAIIKEAEKFGISPKECSVYVEIYF